MKDIYNIERLRIKESDRILSTSHMLNKAGVKTEIGKDYLKIFGVEEFKGCRIDSFNDHRIFITLSLITHALDVTIDNETCINKSYPTFLEELERMEVK